ncbi:2-oxo acid dehydrogenase subunit E2 [Hoeflea sp.]|uniref:2-oxo acid dehydrogenase subunit E2 n=1 Tax=Hoeflea sp. TaxID=1940281 RepID=UPI003B013F3D
MRLPPMQRQLATVMLNSWSQAPQCTVFADADVSRLRELRRDLKSKSAAPSVSHFVLVALARALLAHPRLNAHLDGDRMSEHTTVNIGFAVALDNGGLTAPVLRDAGGWDAFTMAREAGALLEKALAGRLAHSDMRGATFTFSNAGQSRSPRYATPILPLPQVAILAVTAMRPDPVVRDGAVTIADILPLSLTFDHRAINGQQANAFLDSLVDQLAQPDELLSPINQEETS